MVTTDIAFSLYGHGGPVVFDGYWPGIAPAPSENAPFGRFILFHQRTNPGQVWLLLDRGMGVRVTDVFAWDISGLHM